jgi:hypothetical protein
MPLGISLKRITSESERILTNNMQETIKEPIANLRRAGKRIVVIALAFIGGLFLWAQDSKLTQPPSALAAPVSPTSPNILPPIQLDESSVLSHLNQLINWYRHSTTGIQPVGLPSDAIYQDNAKTLGSQVVRLAFQSAKAEAALITAQQKRNGVHQPSAETTQQQNLAQMSDQDFGSDRSVAIADRNSGLANCENTAGSSGRADFPARRSSESIGASESSP